MYSIEIIGITVIWLLQHAQALPNFIVIVADDVGFGDLQCYGHPSQEGGSIDRMAKEGMKFQNWYSGAGSSSASRAALLTGKLPVRMGIYGDALEFQATDSGGLPTSEITIAEALAEAGYSTGMVGKWHLGINQDSSEDGSHLPHNHGFQYVGTLYPLGQVWKCNRNEFTVEEMKSDCFRYENTVIKQQPIYPENSTAFLVSDAKSFIESQLSTQPFYLYLSFLQTHDSLFCSEGFCGRSRRGLYGDNLNELSWAVGEILSTLHNLNIDEETMVTFLSINGPNRDMCTQGGSSGLFSGGKPSSSEGGIRVPAIVRWPGVVKAGQINYEPVSSLDIFPTLLNLSGQDYAGYKLDGQSISGVMTNGESSPHEFIYHYCADRLMAVTMKNLKFHFYRKNSMKKFCANGKPSASSQLLLDQCYGSDVMAYDPPLMYDINKDPAEIFPLNSSSSKYSEILTYVSEAVEKHRMSVETVDSQIGNYDKDLQPCCNPPHCICNYPSSSNSLHAVFSFSNIVTISSLLIINAF